MINIKIEKVEHYKQNKKAVSEWIITSKLNKLICKEMLKYASIDSIRPYVIDYTMMMSDDQKNKIYDSIKKKGLENTLNNFKYHRNEILIKIINRWSHY